MLTLDQRIPEKGFSDPEEALFTFMDWVADQGLSLYPHQEQAILEIFAGNHVVLDAPTGSGKSLVAVAQHFKTFAETGRSFYTAPIKALVSEKFFALCKIFGAEFVGMMTGDGAVNRDAPILCCTAEVLANLALREGDKAKVDSVVMDEFHYYADRDRGMAWQVPLLVLPQTTFVLMSGTLGDTTRIREDLELRTGRPVAEVVGSHRPVPLSFEYAEIPIHESIERQVRRDRAPVYIVHFTQRAATEQAQALTSTDFCTKEEKQALAVALKGFRFDSPFGQTIRRYVSHGIGLHHAGLLPRYRMLVEKLAQQGLLKVICGTDTLGVGINVPIRTVLFTQLCKYDGEKVDLLKVRDFKQIGGRAGRAGFDTEGFVVVQAPAHVIDNLRLDAKIKEGKKKKKVVKAQPPNRGYKHWDREIFQQLVDRPPEPLESRFTVDHGRLLTMMQYADEVHRDASVGYRAMLDLVDQSHATAAEKEALKHRAAELLESLDRAGVLTFEGERLRLDPGLQHDFSLHHSLSLYLLSAIEALDPAAPTWALDVVTMVESILESPRPVLLQQARKAGDLVLADLKAQGIPYEERIELMHEVSWPKPLAELIYALFNAYAERHPWVAGEAIQPKSIVRDMIERYASFTDYVKDLGLERVEGLLLRYLSEAYKALVQNVPAERHTDELDDIIAFLRAMLARVDSSLVTEWETLLAGRDLPAEVGPPKVDISADTKRFHARIRAELHALVRALAAGDWEEAAACTCREEEDPFGADEISATMAPFIEEFGGVAFDHRARLANNTRIKQDGPHLWTVRRVLVPHFLPEGEEEDEVAWSIEGRIDLSQDTNPSGPLVRILSIGE